MRRIVTWPRAILLMITAVAIAAWWVPRLSADKFREPIHQALENALGRKVKIGTVKFRLLPLPGFTVKDVIVAEDPSLGAEPLAYVTTLRARPAVASLFGGALAFASVDLEDASINLTRVDRGGEGVRWNFAALMNPRLLATFPNIHMASGRVNFKLEDTKSVFYLLNTDVDVWPPSSPDRAWTFRMRAEPARTDRPSRGFAALTARAEWFPRTRRIAADAKLEKSEVDDILTLFEGYESNVHGHVSGSAHLAGPLNELGVAGRIAIDEIHGWNQTPPRGGAWPFDISGVIDVPGQSIQLRALVAGAKPSPLDLRYRVADYLGRPKWSANALLTKLPVAPLVTIARNLGANVPPDMSMEGTADGEVAYAVEGGAPRMSGEVRVVAPALRFADTALKVPEIDLKLDGSRITMPPVVLTNDANESASLDWAWDAEERDVEASISSDGMSIASLRRQLGAAAVPLLGQATSGIWSGSVRNDTGTDGWTGDVHIKDALIPFEAFSEPLRITSADASISGTDFEVKHMLFSIGGIEGAGEYSYTAAEQRPHRFRLAIGNADAPVIERLLMPALHRGSFLTYAFNFGRVPEPGWMQAMHAEGSVQIGTLNIAGKTASKVHLNVLWDGGDVRCEDVSARFAEGDFSGVAMADLSQRQPKYSLEGKLTGVPWLNGLVSLTGSGETSGTGSGLAENFTAKGMAMGKGLSIGTGSSWDSGQAAFDWDPGKSRLDLRDLMLVRGRDTYKGDGGLTRDGELEIRASSGGRQLRAPIRLALP